jgi:predicted ATP-grasp superfamily ATP-dependent carboligase
MSAGGDPHSARATVSALVLDAAERQALVAVRALGRAGVRVGAADGDPHAPAFRSRWCSRRVVLPGFVEDPELFVNRLAQACAELRPAAVIPAHDGSVEALRGRRERVERFAGLALAPENALAVAVDKARTLAIARELGLNGPRGEVVHRPEDLPAALAEVGLPAVVKPARTWVQAGGRGRRLRATVCRSREETTAAAESMLGCGTHVLLQEWLPGERQALSFMCAHGRIWARFAQRALRTLPPLGGNSIVREGIPMPLDIAAPSERLVLELGLDGYCEVEFRRDAAGRAMLMEINPRLSASVEAAVHAGVPFPELLYRWAHGLPLAQTGGYRIGRRVRWVGGDVLWLEDVLRAPGQPDAPGPAAALAAFVTAFFVPMRYDYLDPRDPAPMLEATAGAARNAARRAARFAGKRARRRPTAARGDGADTQVAVIGAGPYGLALSAHLSGRGVAHEIFGEPMGLWRSHMPVGMYLKSEGFASNISEPRGELTLARYCAERDLEYGDVAVPIPLETFAGYGNCFQERLVPHLRQTEVTAVRPGRGRFEIELATGESLAAREVAVATGAYGLARLPSQLAGLDGDRVIHTFDYRLPERSRGVEVAVLGAGQSALEAAALIHERGGRPTIIARRDRIAWNSKPGLPGTRSLGERLRYPDSGLGQGLEQRMCARHPLVFHAAPGGFRSTAAHSILGPAGAWWLRPRIENKVRCLVGCSLAHAETRAGKVALLLDGPDGREEVEVDEVVAGTGYRPDIERLAFLDPRLRAKVATVSGAPALTRSFESSLPGLYFVGYAAAIAFGPLMRFVFGTEFAARRLARRVSAGAPRSG